MKIRLSLGRSVVSWLWCFSLLGGVIPGYALELATRNFAVELTATFSKNPPEIRLHWPVDLYARSYTIHRKMPGEPAWKQIGTADTTATSFLDSDVQLGTIYEYMVAKEGVVDFKGYGYITVGIDVPMVEKRGKIIVVAEATAAEILASELKRLEYDLVGDGWMVARTTVAANDSPVVVKDKIRSIYEADRENTIALLLFGKVPVAYSGNITPDEHDNHRGAWPADVYYADLDGHWTDETVTSTGAERVRNHNLPGDGKFDQSELPSAVELQVGRVDLSNLTCFSNKTPKRTEIDLLRQYLDKNHRFRHAQVKVESRALLFDRYGVQKPEALAAWAWRNFTPFVGAEVQVIYDSQYFPTASAKTFLWSGVCAGGGYTHSDWVGTSDNFALNEVNVVFTSFIGSYFGDWDNESNFLRAALGASGTLLTSTYSGKPQWLFHPMAIGATIGNSAKLTQENGLTSTYLPIQPGNGQVHISLHGDPSLRAHPIDPVPSIEGQTNGATLLLKWGASPAPRLMGYHIYKVNSPAAGVERLNQELFTGTELTVPFSPGDIFMVRAVAMTESPSGSYQNASQGVFFPDPLVEYTGLAPEAPVNVGVTKVSQNSISLRWISNAGNEAGFIIERKDPGVGEFKEVARVNGDQETFTDFNLAGDGIYHYRVAAWNAAGVSPYSVETSINTQSASVEFLYLDTAHKGDWIGRYGSEGYLLVGVGDFLPSNVTLVNSNTFLYAPGRTEDPRGLEIPNEKFRSPNCWVGSYPYGFNISFADDASHQVTFYTMAWARQNTRSRVQMYDTVTGRLLDDRVLGNVNEGGFAVYNMRRQIHIRIIPPGVFTNTEIYGFFIDKVQVSPPRIQPDGGNFAGKTQVQITSTTPGARIHFTLDGSEPTEKSPIYSEPVLLLGNTHVRARSFRDGAASAVITEARFTNAVSSDLAYVRWDSQTSGSWIGTHGGDGYMVPGSEFVPASQSIPAFAQVSFSDAAPWTWNEVTEDARALYIDPSARKRRASAWYTAKSMMLNLNIADDRTREVALYFADFDGIGREQEVEVINGYDSVVEKFVLKNFQSGKYLVLGMKGKARVRVTHKNGGNAVINGVFFNSAPAEVIEYTPATLSYTQAADGFFTFTLQGTPKAKVCIDKSGDLVDWDCVATNSLAEPAFTVKLPIELSPRRFFRSHYVQ